MYSDSNKLATLDVNTLSFDSFGRSAQDIICVAPVRTVVRREEEITLVRRVRKVEDIDASPACPVSTTQLSDVSLSDGNGY
jgi:hypothetical protein